MAKLVVMLLFCSSIAGDSFAQVEECRVCDPNLTAYAMYNLYWVILAGTEVTHEQVHPFFCVK